MHNRPVLYYPYGHEAHYDPGHPERPERLEVIRETIQQAGWWDRFTHVGPITVSEELLEAVHTPAYLDFLVTACQNSESLDPDTYTTPASCPLAMKAAGGAVAVARQVWQGAAKQGLALTRPPGHHATRQRGMGFCLINNIAIAAEDLIRNEGAGRLAIVDLDLHHGNGTQDIFWERGDVLFISVHQSPLFPGTGFLDETGAGAGKGTTVNLPLPPYSGDLAMLTAMDQVILPLLDRYAPQMILSSIGFDVHWRDPLGQLLVSADCYTHLIERLNTWAVEHCDGRLAMFLEGGYDLEAGAACALGVCSILLKEPWQDPLGPSPVPERNGWRTVIDQARRLWSL